MPVSTVTTSPNFDGSMNFARVSTMGKPRLARGEDVDAALYTMRTHPRFETGDPRYSGSITQFAWRQAYAARTGACERIKVLEGGGLIAASICPKRHKLRRAGFSPIQIASGSPAHRNRDALGRSNVQLYSTGHSYQAASRGSRSYPPARGSRGHLSVRGL